MSLLIRQNQFQRNKVETAQRQRKVIFVFLQYSFINSISQLYNNILIISFTSSQKSLSARGVIVVLAFIIHAAFPVLSFNAVCHLYIVFFFLGTKQDADYNARHIDDRCRDSHGKVKIRTREIFRSHGVKQSHFKEDGKKKQTRKMWQK